MFALLLSIALGGPVSIYDDHPGVAEVDGTIDPSEYASVVSEGSGTGFGNVFGTSSTLRFDADDLGSLVVGFEQGPGTFNDMAVIYLDTRPGGTPSLNGLTDTTDRHRAAISGVGISGGSANINFPSGMLPDWAIAFDGSGFAGVWAIVGTGPDYSLEFFAELDRTIVGNAHEMTGVTLAELDVGPDGFKWFGTYLNTDNAFRSNELHGTNDLPSNIGSTSVDLGAESHFIPGPLPPGAIVFHDYGADIPRRLSFVTMQPIAPGTTLTVSENGWLPSGALRNGEGRIDWRATEALPAGTEVLFEPGSSADSTVVSEGEIIGADQVFALSTSGDQALAYQGPEDRPWFLAALQMNGPWDDPESDSFTTNMSIEPPGIAGASMFIEPEVDNARYTCAVTVGLADDVRAAAVDAGNWEASNDLLLPAESCVWDIAACGDGVCDDVESLEICPADCAFTHDFTGGEDGWQIGSQGGDSQPSQVPSGGPDNPHDAYLTYTSDNAGAAGKMVIFNTGPDVTGDLSDWRQLSFNARVTGDSTTELVLRPIAEGGGQSITTTEGITVPADGQWHRVELDFTGEWSADPAAVLADVSRLRIVHNPAATTSPPNISATLDIDDVSNTPPPPRCGDNIVNLDEVCDGDDLDGLTCSDSGFTDPSGLACNDTCDAVVQTGCVSECGDGAVEPGETCDDAGFSATCDDDCTAVDPQDGVCNPIAEDPNSAPDDCPTECNDGVISGDEVCDGDDLDGLDCTDFGYATTGTLACADSCGDFDLSGCTNTCGDGIEEPGEECDESGFAVDCDDDCTFVLADDGVCNPEAENANTAPADCPAVCGDSFITHNEVCDGDDFGSASCDTEGFDAGDLACDACTGLVTSACTFTCGNNAVGGTEVCDGTDLDGMTCTDFGYAIPGGLACDAACDDFDASGCTAVCGNGTFEPDEGCDDGNTTPDDGCSAACGIEDGWSCLPGETADVCTPLCGDGVVLGDEECDDANEDADDGCADDCLVEDFFVCDEAEPSVCRPDADEDGVADDDDNCPDDANEDQADDDDNGVGDACEESDTDVDTEPQPDTDAEPDTDADEAGCSCQSSPTGAVWLLPLALVGLRRRRN